MTLIFDEVGVNIQKDMSNLEELKQEEIIVKNVIEELKEHIAQNGNKLDILTKENPTGASRGVTQKEDIANVVPIINGTSNPVVESEDAIEIGETVQENNVIDNNISQEKAQLVSYIISKENKEIDQFKISDEIEIIKENEKVEDKASKILLITKIVEDVDTKTLTESEVNMEARIEEKEKIPEIETNTENEVNIIENMTQKEKYLPKEKTDNHVNMETVNTETDIYDEYEIKDDSHHETQTMNAAMEIDDITLNDVTLDNTNLDDTTLDDTTLDDTTLDDTSLDDTTLDESILDESNTLDNEEQSKITEVITEDSENIDVKNDESKKCQRENILTDNQNKADKKSDVEVQCSSSSSSSIILSTNDANESQNMDIDEDINNINASKEKAEATLDPVCLDTEHADIVLNNTYDNSKKVDTDINVASEENEEKKSINDLIRKEEVNREEESGEKNEVDEVSKKVDTPSEQIDNSKIAIAVAEETSISTKTSSAEDETVNDEKNKTKRLDEGMLYKEEEGDTTVTIAEKQISTTAMDVEENDETEIIEMVNEVENVSLDINNEVVKTTQNLTDNPPDVEKDNDYPIITEVISGDTLNTEAVKNKFSHEIVNLDDVKDAEENTEQNKPKTSTVTVKPLCQLSNNLDILSDDDEENNKEDVLNEKTVDKQCIQIEDDDDIMLIDEDTSKETQNNKSSISDKVNNGLDERKIDLETGEQKSSFLEAVELSPKITQTELKPLPIDATDTCIVPHVNEELFDGKLSKLDNKPLLPEDFLKSVNKNLAEMTRDDLEDFCILKICESIVDRSNLNEIKTKVKTIAHTLEDYKKKVLALVKQNRDLQVVLKSIQEEQKNKPNHAIIPLKITRSVGMQVLMLDNAAQQKNMTPLSGLSTPSTRQSARQTASRYKPKSVNNTQQNIPVPRLVPAATGAKATPPKQTNSVNKVPNSAVNGPKAAQPPTPQKAPEKRPFNKSQSQVMVDLTDDEPPAKVSTRSSPAPPVRLVPSQNLIGSPRQFLPGGVSSPRKVYIPISGPQGQTIRPGQTIMLKTMPNFTNAKPKSSNPPHARMPSAVRISRAPAVARHPAPLPDVMKQYQPPTWKQLPPAPDLKLSKIENGIVISWSVDNCPVDSYEQVASYQLYAYQEPSAPPSTSLWKKIGDVKALPLPMACTLTQFMAGFKYYFAVRAVDIRSRLGPFSLPASILLYNKL